jgi:dihydroorotate dehydrogenase electron transfer subunit
VDVVGPLGRPFPAAPRGARALLVGGGYGAAALVGLAERLRGQGNPVDVVAGAAAADRLCSVQELTGLADRVEVTTDDGSSGRQGLVTLAVEELLPSAGVVYACGPMPMLRAVADAATARGIPSYVAVEESMACGIGVCMTCVLPIVGEDGRTRFSRSCTEGPVFGGDRVRFADVGTLPWDVLGADAMGVLPA